jgi:hypothetical protein
MSKMVRRIYEDLLECKFCARYCLGWREWNELMRFGGKIL